MLAKSSYSRSGAEGTRTPALRRAKALRAFRVRPSASACLAQTGLFPQIEEIGVPAPFVSVLVGLLHGCCTRVTLQRHVSNMQSAAHPRSHATCSDQGCLNR